MVIDIRSLAPGQTKAALSKSDKAKKKDSAGGAANSAGDADDSVNITGQASQISQLIHLMKNSPVLDPDRVSPVKEKVDKGTYEIEYQQVANKMLDFEVSYQGY